MKVNRKNPPNYVRFDSLKVGDVFVEEVGGDEYVQMRIPDVSEDGSTYRAVSLKTGEIYEMENGAPVELVEAEVIIYWGVRSRAPI